MMRRLIWLPVIAFACFAVGYFFCWLYRLPFVELEKERQAIKASGKPMRYEEIVQPISSSLNTAMVYQKAILAFPKFTGSEWQLINDFLFGRPADMKQVRHLLRRCQKSLALMKKASQLPHVRWVKLQPLLYTTQLRHLSSLRLLIRLLQAEALLRIQEGHADRALANCVVLLRMVRHLDQEPFASHMWRMMLIFRAISEIVERICKNINISPQWIYHLTQFVPDWDGDRSLIRLLQLERVMHMQSFDYLRLSPKLAREFSLIWSEGCQIYRGGNIVGWMQPLSRQLAINELIVLRFYRRLLEIAREGEPYDWSEFKTLNEFTKRVKERGFAFNHLSFLKDLAFRPLAMAGEVLSSDRFWGSTWAFEGIATAKAYQRLLQTPLALILCRHEFGSYPATLSGLVPRFLPTVPKNPFDGEPYATNSNDLPELTNCRGAHSPSL